jgi:hypothetical protein
MTTGRPESAARIEKDTIGASVAVAAARSANANTFCALIASAVSTTTGVAAPLNAAACKSKVGKKSDGSQSINIWLNGGAETQNSQFSGNVEIISQILDRQKAECASNGNEESQKFYPFRVPIVAMRACGSALAGRSMLAAVHAALPLPLPLLTDDCERPNEVDASTAAQLRQLPVRPLSAAEVCRKAEMTVVAVWATTGVGRINIIGVHNQVLRELREDIRVRFVLKKQKNITYPLDPTLPVNENKR